LKQLKILDLSNNQLSDNVSNQLCKVLFNMKLNEVYLHWNSFTGDGAAKMFEAIQENHYIKVFDISYNRIGTIGWLAFQKQFNKFLK
jgi:Ran GTPase-activating protein (RanGAP) involved in mRNA processing and transport